MHDTNSQEKRTSSLVQNGIFAAIICFLLAGPFVLLCSQEVAKVEMPSWLTSEDAIRLAGGTAKHDIDQALSVAGFQKGELQSLLSDGLSNHIPLKAIALNGNAAAERILIESGKSLFGWRFVPTGLGSGYLYMEDVDAVAHIPAVTSQIEHGCYNFGDHAARFAEQHPNLDVVIYVAGGYQHPAASPVYDIGESANFDYIMTRFAKGIGDCPDNLHLLGSEYDSVEDYYHDFYRTDHHWNPRGAYKAYGQIADVLDMEVAESSGEIPIEGHVFAGALQRTSLYTIEEEIFDLDIDYGNLSVLDEDGNVISDVTSREEFWANANSRVLSGFYDQYFDDLELNRIVGGDGDRHLCLISNSYGAGIQRMLAVSSASFQGFRDLHPSFDRLETLNDRIAQSDADTVIFVATPKDYAILGNAFPGYFAAN